MPTRREDPSYWQLVNQLMCHGWYRSGEQRIGLSGQQTWGFRHGHLLPGRLGPLWIAAPDEVTAMRILLRKIADRMVPLAR